MCECCSPNPYDEGTERTPGRSGCRRGHGCSPNPYDEGTESALWAWLEALQVLAAAQIPMMRELKGRRQVRRRQVRRSCSPNPYDEGTERLDIIALVMQCEGCSPNPYDEGTESGTRPDGASPRPRCSPNPYDEGTERSSLAVSISLRFLLQPKSL